MTAPTIVGTFGIGRTATTNVHSFTSPAHRLADDADTLGYNAVGSGMNNNMRLAVIGFGANPGTVTMPNSWILCGSAVQGTAVYMRAFWSQHFASQNNVTLTCSTSNAVQSAIFVAAILDSGSNSLPIQGAVAVSSSTNADPPSYTPTSFTGENIMWIATCAIDGGQWVTAYPTNYSDNNYSIVGSGAAGVGLGFATRTVSAATENPGTFTSSRNAWNAMTFAVRNTATPDRAFISSLMFGAQAERRELLMVCSVDLMLLDERRQSTLDRFATDYLFLLSVSSAVYVASTAAFTINVACATDYLLLDTYRQSEIERVFNDGTLLYDVSYRDTAKQAYDQLLLDDAAATQADRIVAEIDYLLLGFARISEQLGQQQDGALLLDGRVSDVAHGFLDSLLLDSTVGAAVERIVEALDKLLTWDYVNQIDQSHDLQDAVLLGDAYSATLERVLQDALLLVSLRASGADVQQTDYLLTDSYALRILEALSVDNLFLYDTVDLLRGANETILAFVDQLFLNDERISELDRQVLDSLLTLSLITKFIERIDAEGVLLTDGTSVAERLVTVLAIDYLFLLSRMVQERESVQQDSVLLGDEAFRDLAKVLVDSLFLLSTVAADSGKEVLAADSLLLGDESVRERLMQLLDNELLGDAGIRDIARTLISFLLLNDMRTSETERNLLEGVLLGDDQSKDNLRTIIDSLFIDDTSVRDRELRAQADALLLGDDAFRDLLRQAIDSVLLGDGEAPRVREMNLMSNVYLDDLITFAREMLIDEGLPLGDLSSLVLGAISTTMITYARLAHKRLLSPMIAGRDLLSRRTGSNANTLGRTIGYNSWRLWQ